MKNPRMRARNRNTPTLTPPATQAHDAGTIARLRPAPALITALIPALAPAFLLVAAGGLGGCRGEGVLVSGTGEITRVAPSDFVIERPAGAERGTPPPADGTSVDGTRPVEPANTRTDSPRPTVLPTSPSGQVPVVRAVPEATTPGVANLARVEPIERAVIIDAKVGDINGRPIYAGDFLEPIAARLEAEATRRPVLEWRAFAREQIRRELDALIEDELLRAEAIASLDPQQRAGLVNFLEQLRGNVIRRTGGSSVLAQQRIEQETGQDVERFLDEQRTRELIRFQLEQSVNNRVNVRWRDIVLEYERQWEQFNPPAEVDATMLRVARDRAEDAAEIQRRIDAGDDWAVIATETANTHARGDAGRILPAPEFRGDIAEADLFANATINQALRSLGPGESTGPLEVGSQLVWLRMNGITQESIPLYEAQLRIERWLRQVREAEERARYIERLKGEASLTNEDEIVDRLLSIAEERHGPLAVTPG